MLHTAPCSLCLDALVVYIEVFVDVYKDICKVPLKCIATTLLTDETAMITSSVLSDFVAAVSNALSATMSDLFEVLSRFGVSAHLVGQGSTCTNMREYIQ